MRGHCTLDVWNNNDDDDLRALMRAGHPFVTFRRSPFAFASKLAPEHQYNLLLGPFILPSNYTVLSSSIEEHSAATRVDRRYTHHSMYEVVLARHLNYVLYAPRL